MIWVGTESLVSSPQLQRETVLFWKVLTQVPARKSWLSESLSQWGWVGGAPAHRWGWGTAPLGGLAPSAVTRRPTWPSVARDAGVRIQDLGRVSPGSCLELCVGQGAGQAEGAGPKTWVPLA